MFPQKQQLTQASVLLYIECLFPSVVRTTAASIYQSCHLLIYNLFTIRITTILQMEKTRSQSDYKMMTALKPKHY